MNELNFVYAILLGAVQGFTEFLPVSSSGHLVIFQKLLGMEEPRLLLNISLHLGTSAAVIAVFRKDIFKLFSSAKFLLLLITASVPTFFIGVCLSQISGMLFSNTRLVSGMFFVTGVWLLLPRVLGKGKIKEGSRSALTLWKAFLIGTAQGIAAIPGISRSGATISTGLLLNIDRAEAVRFSFLLSIPVIAGAFIFELITHPLPAGFISSDLSLFGAGMLTAGITGYFAIKIVLRVVASNRFHWFAAYCFAAGLLSVLV